MTENQAPESTPDNLIATITATAPAPVVDPVNGGAPEPNPTPVAPDPAVNQQPDPQPVDIWVTVKEKTGGLVSSLDDVIALASKPVAQPAEPQPQYHDVAKKVNDLLLSGASPEVVRGFIEAQYTDYRQISDLERIQKYYQDKYPNLSQEDISTYMVENGIVAAPATPTEKIRLSEESAAALAHLEAKKVQMANPQPLVSMQEEKSRSENLATGWGKVFEKVQDVPFEFKMEIPAESGKVNYDFNIKPDKQIVDVAREAARIWLIENKMAFTPENLSQAMEVGKGFAIAANPQYFISKAIAGFLAQSKKAEVENERGLPPNQQLQRNPAPVAKPPVYGNKPKG